MAAENGLAEPMFFMLRPGSLLLRSAVLLLELPLKEIYSNEKCT